MSDVARIPVTLRWPNGHHEVVGSGTLRDDNTLVAEISGERLSANFSQKLELNQILEVSINICYRPAKKEDK